MSKKALITGSSRGIGAEIAKILSGDGWDLTLNYIDPESGEKAKGLAESLGAKLVRADVSEPGQVDKLFSVSGDVDLLINNAGIAYYGLLTDTDIDTWSRIFAVNVQGAYNCTVRAVPHMVSEKCGCIINISSILGRIGGSCEAAYSASKSALIGLSLSMAKELGPSGIRVNCIAPGAIDTDMLSCFSPREKADIIDETPLGRMGTPADVAELVSFLASDKASFITGQVIGVDGAYGL